LGSKFNIQQLSEVRSLRGRFNLSASSLGRSFLRMLSGPAQFVLSLSLSVLLVSTALPQQEVSARSVSYELNIPAENLDAALQALALASHHKLLYRAELVAGKASPALIGTYTTEEAVTRLLEGTKLSFEITAASVVLIKGQDDLSSQPYIVPSASDPNPASNAKGGEDKKSSDFRLAQVDQGPAKSDDTVTTEDKKFAKVSKSDDSTGAIAEILVVGSKSLDADIQRTEDDIQPYKVFTRDQIEKSGVNDVQTFLTERVTSMSNLGSSSQSTFSTNGSNQSTFNLRGLGVNQTLILIDGRRAAPVSFLGGANQSDINGIPLSAIERIEVLPATASGIYGGGATGGVINVVLRRDYKGLEVKLTGGDSFSGGGMTRRLDFGGGFDLEGGKTTVLVTGSYSHGTEVRVGDRPFQTNGRTSFLSNDPAALLGASIPPLGGTTNIAAVGAYAPVPAGTPGAIGPYGGVYYALQQPNLTLASNGASLNSPITSVPIGYGGPATDGGAAFLANAGKYNLGLANTAQLGAGAQSALLNEPVVSSLTASIRRDLTPWLHAFMDISGSKNVGYATGNNLAGAFDIPAGAPGNPFAQEVEVTTPALGTNGVQSTTSSDIRALTGLIIDLPHGWRAEADYTWGKSRFSSTFPASILDPSLSAAISNGTVNVFADTNLHSISFVPYLLPSPTSSPANATINDIVLRASGSIGTQLPGGSPTMTVSLEHRRENLGDLLQVTPYFGGSIVSDFNSRSQNINSAYVELDVPLIAEKNGVPGVHLLDLMLAVRHDRYAMTGADVSTFAPFLGLPTPPPPARGDDTFSSADETFGLRYQPIQDVTFRGSYSTGFNPPALNQLVPNAPYAIAPGLTDPKRANESVGAVTTLSGGSPTLRPELSISTSIGAIITPRWIPTLRVSADWTKIRKRDNIGPPAIDQDTLNNESSYPGVYIRGPASDGFAVGPIIGINAVDQNIARQEIEAYDFAFDYRWDLSRWGAVTLSGIATHNVHATFQFQPTSATLDSAGESGANSWTAVASIGWEYRQWALRWSARYFNAYYSLIDHSVLPGQSGPKVPPQTYNDLFASYTFDQSRGAFSNVQVQLSVKNILNAIPPVDLNSPEYYSYYGDPRLANYLFSVKKSF
jgi:iron complex outermembrane receptor protein